MIAHYRSSEHAFVLSVVDASTDRQTDINFLLPRLSNSVDPIIADVHLSSGSCLPVIPIIKGSAFTSAQANTRDSLITLKLMTNTGSTHLIVISAWKLQQCIIQERQGMAGDCNSPSTVQWYSWGPICTTLLTDIPRSVQSIGGVQPVDGTRLIMPDKASKRLAVYEFGRFIVRQAERVNPSSVLGHFSFVECDSLFEDRVLTCLPYIKYVTERKDDNNMVIGMANDYIVLIKVNPPESTLRLRGADDVCTRIRKRKARTPLVASFYRFESAFFFTTQKLHNAALYSSHTDINLRSWDT